MLMSPQQYNLGRGATQLRPLGSQYTALAKAGELGAQDGTRVLYVASASRLRKFVCFMGASASRLQDGTRGGVNARHVAVDLEKALALPTTTLDRFTHVVCDVVASGTVSVSDWVRFIRCCDAPVFVAYSARGANPVVSKGAAQLAAAQVSQPVQAAMGQHDWDGVRLRRDTLNAYPDKDLDDGDDAACETVSSLWVQIVKDRRARVAQEADTLWVQDVRGRRKFQELAEVCGGSLTEAQVLLELRRGGLSRRLTLASDGRWGRWHQRMEQHEAADGEEADLAEDLSSLTGVAAVSRRSWLSSTARLFRLLPPRVARLVRLGEPVSVSRADSDVVASRLAQLQAEEPDGGVTLADPTWRSLWLRATSAAGRPSVRLVVGVLERLGYCSSGEGRVLVGGLRVRSVSMVAVATKMALAPRLQADDSDQPEKVASISIRDSIEKLATPSNHEETSASNLPRSAMFVAANIRSVAAAVYASRFPSTTADPLHARCLLYPQTQAESALTTRTGDQPGARVMTQKDISRGIAGAALVRTHSRALADGTMLLPIPPRAQWAEQRTAARIEVTYLGGSRTSLQCVSREVRQVMRPLPGYRFVSVDMVCAHLRIAEALCRVLSPSNKYFANLFGSGDLYKAFGDLTGLTRDEAKKAAIMLLNGATAEGLRKEYPHLSEAACEAAVAAWKKGNPWCTKTSHSIAGNAEAAARYQRIPKFKRRDTDKGASTYTSLWLQMEENRILQAALKDLGDSVDLVLPMYDGALFVVPEGQEHAAADKVAAAFQRACVACGYPRIEVKAGVGETWGEAETSSTKRAAQ